MPAPGMHENMMEARHRKDGFGSLDNPESIFNQDYQQLKQDCVTQRFRFVDDMFPPDSNSIGEGVLSLTDLDRVQWLRPGEIAPNPSLIVNAISRFDFGQGKIGNCWFLAAVGSLAFQNNILKQVIPPGQIFNEEYCGLFHFRFWRFGRWVDVVIDDKLPTIDGRLIFVHSTTPNEFWPALLEKAYAKVCGSYAGMNAGTPAEALMDFTGGVHIYVDLKDPPPNLWELMCRAGQSQSLMGCGTPQGETSENTVAANGLVEGHAYTVTGVKQVMSQEKVESLIRLWNPWGKREWNGDWSDRSPLWNTVSPQERDLCLAVADNGEFWMTIADFCKYFKSLDICCKCPSFLDGSKSCHWKASVYESRWVAGTTAGGPKKYDSFWINPQFRITIGKLLGECAETQNVNNMLVSLMQKPDKRNRRLVKNLYIGFYVFEVNKTFMRKKGKFPASFFSHHSPVAQTKAFLNARDVMEFFLLKPGEYLIVPSTFKPNETASFILTILAKTETHIHENSRGHNHEPVEFAGPKPDEYKADDTNIDLSHHVKNEDVGAEKLQKYLNEQILKGDLRAGGFSLDACRSMVALMDTSITGTLREPEFVRLWRKVIKYKDIFVSTDVSHSGTLSLSELKNAIMAAGLRINDDMIKLMAVRYGASGETGGLTLAGFISLILRMECMYQMFKQMSDGMTMTLRSSEWMFVTMYT
ncbi:calpain-1 catalytic subunit-like [Genypterus blacodes]|uniref:calpain-1 catalytic subunit-like n=1 Tax=Genypterus blacodes TaxID=154954 RepID=UPI003F7779FF